MGLHLDVVAVRGDRCSRADVDAKVAAGLVRSAVCADRWFVRKISRLLEFADHRGKFRDRLRLRHRIAARGEVSLRGLMHP